MDSFSSVFQPNYFQVRETYASVKNVVFLFTINGSQFSKDEDYCVSKDSLIFIELYLKIIVFHICTVFFLLGKTLSLATFY